MKLLIADDETHIRLLLEQTFEDLEEEGVELLFAENGLEALALIREAQPKLVFLDVMMPFLNGMEVCATVKSDPAFADVHIVLLTAKGQEIDRQQGLEVGADQYLTKPFDPDALLKMARKVLDLPK